MCISGFFFLQGFGYIESSVIDKLEMGAVSAGFASVLGLNLVHLSECFRFGNLFKILKLLNSSRSVSSVVVWGLPDCLLLNTRKEKCVVKWGGV